jgi:hypothetical protein
MPFPAFPSETVEPDGRAGSGKLRQCKADADEAGAGKQAASTFRANSELIAAILIELRR